jgi:hypothetical protein
MASPSAYLTNVLRTLNSTVRKANVHNANVLQQLKKAKTAVKKVRKSLTRR